MTAEFDLIVASKDWHPKQHGSFAATHGKQPSEIIHLDGLKQILWPTHCVQNSEGASFSPGWDHSKVGCLIYKGVDESIDSYSIFFDNAQRRSTGLYEILKEKKINTLYITGLVTDYCVKFSALDALELGFNVFVVTDGCRGVNLQEGDDLKAFKEMEQVGAILVDSSEVLKKLKTKRK